MKMWNKIIKAGISVMVGLVLTVAANATVVYPALDVQQLNADMGVASNSTGLTMDGTAFAIIYPDGSNWPGFPDQNFSLTSDATGSGTLSVGHGSILTATFSNLTLSDLGLLGSAFSGVGNFAADLSYTGGSMAANLAGGRIEGVFNNATGIIGLGNTFTAGNMMIKLGKVQTVPVPAAVWLFGAGLLGLFGLAKRRQVA